MKNFTFLFVFMITGMFLHAQGTAPADTDSDGRLEISTKANLLYLSQNPGADWSASYEQTADIVFAAADFETGGDFYNSGEGFVPIGNNSVQFTGVYDGQDHSIENLFIDRNEENQGFFGYLDAAEVKNLGLTNADIDGDGKTGGLAGRIENASTINNAYVTGNVTGSVYVGGLVGVSLEAHVDSAYAEVSVTGSQAGGLVGYNSSGTVSNSYSSGSVTGNYYHIGGLVGNNNANATISNSYSRSSVGGNGNNVGGLVGNNKNSTINNCYSTGSVNGQSQLGGLVGNGEENYVVTNSFWDLQTSGITSSGFEGTPRLTSQMKDYTTFTGAGWDFVSETINGTEDIWDADQNMDVNDGYPILSWQEGADNLLEHHYSGGAGTAENPYQIATTDDLIELSNTSTDWDKHFIQTADIAFNADENTVDWDGDGTVGDADDAAGFSPIGNSTTAFSGNYNGQDYETGNLFIYRNSTNYIGLFGYTNGSEIINLTLNGLNITGGEDYVGGLAGYATGSTFTNITVSGTVTGMYNLGGLAGLTSDCPVSGCTASNIAVDASGSTNSGSNIGGLIGLALGPDSVIDCTASGIVTSDGGEDVGGLIGESQVDVTGCSSTVNVDAVDYVGGLIGYPDGCTVSNSYSTGSVEGDDWVGGFLGDAEATTVTNCYSSGNVMGADWTGGFIGRCTDDCNINNSHCAAATVTGSNNTGGFIGENDWGVVDKCYTTADVNGGADNVGGFIGLSDDSDGTPEITECYCTGNVDGFTSSSDDTGGFIGENWGLVENCYSRGTVSASGGVTDYFGAFMGYNETSGTVRYCYTTGDFTTEADDHAFIWFNDGSASSNFYDSDLSTQSSGAGATGKTTAEMKTQATFTSAGWDFTGETANGTNDVWSIKGDYNDGYPNLAGESDFLWMGTTSNAWETGSNWNLGSAPGVNDGVRLPDVSGTGGNQPVIGPGVGANAGNLTVDNGATLTISSGASLITTGTITNNGTINTGMEVADDQWSFISSPVNNATAGTFYGDYLQSWDETTSSWLDISDETTPLTVMKGYSLWPPSGKSSYNITGTPNTGDQSIGITYTEVAGAENDGANLVGNPYPSYLDWDQVTGFGAKYTWNGTAYDAYTPTGGYGTGSRYAAPMEGFFVVVESAGTFSLTNAMRTHHPAGKPGEGKTLQNGLVLTATNGNYNDQLWIVFDENKTENFELACDAWKLLSSEEGLSQLWSVSPDGKLAIDVRPETETIQLGFANDQAGFYSISLKEIEGIGEVTLEDTKTNTLHDLSKGGYEFAWEVTDSETRFKLHLNAVGIEETPGSESDILIYAANQQIFVKGAEYGKLTVSDIMGHTLHQQEISDEGLTTIPVNYRTGVYIVTVQNGKEVKTEKVFIK